MKIETRDKEIVFGDVGLSDCAIDKKSGRPFMRIQGESLYNAVWLDTGELISLSLYRECTRVNAKMVIEK